MHIRFALSSEPTSEPVTRAEAKAHAKIEHDHEEALIDAQIVVARQRVEQATLRALITQTWTASFDRWPELCEGETHRRVRLGHFPVQSISSVIVDGVTIASTYYRLSGKDLLVSIEVDDSEDEIDDTGIVITFIAGYGAAAAVPQTLKQAVLMLVAHLYEARGATSPQGIYHQLIPEGVQALLQPYIVLEL